MANSVTLKIEFVGADKGATSTARTVGREITSLGGKVKGLAAGAALLTGGAFLLKWGKQAITTYRMVGADLLKLQRIAGTTDERAAGLYVWAQQSGVATTKLSASLGILSTNIANGKAAKLGLDLKDANGQALPLDQALAKIAARVASMPAGGDRNNLVKALFGRGGLDLLPMLLKGGDAIDVFTKKAEQLGISINSDDIKQATQNQRDLNLAWTAAGVTVGKQVLPYVTQLVGFMARNLPPVVGIVGGLAHAVAGLPMPLKVALGALVALGPAVKVLGVIATPFKLIAAGAKGAQSALTMFRLGLAGATEKGAGFANRIGAAVSATGGLTVAAPLAAAGLALLVYGLAQTAAQAARAKANVSALVEEARQSGKTVGEAFNERLAATVSGAPGGFDLEVSGSWFRQLLKTYDVGAKELSKLLLGPQKDFDAFLQGLNRKNAPREFVGQLERLRAAGDNAKQTAKDLDQAQRDLGVSTDEAAAAATGQAGALDRAAAAAARANQAIEDRIAKVRQQHDADRAAEQATADRVAAEQDLADAEATVAGTSDEARQAARAVEDARRGETDAAEELARAQLSVADARDKLNDAEAEAADRLRDLQQAAREALTGELGARVALRRALKEQERTNASGADKLTRDEAAQRVREAEDALAAAALKRQQTDQKNAAAQAAGVAGDEQVVAARKAVADANDSVTSAEQRLQDAQAATAEAARSQAKVIEDARHKVQEAAKRVEDAMVNEAQAAGDAAAAHDGAAAGALRQIQVLDQLAGRLDPNSPLRRNVQGLADDLAAAFGGPGGGFWANAANLFGGTSSATSGTGSARAGGASPGAANAEPPHVEFHQTNIMQGTPRQQAHALRQAGKDGVAKAVGG